MKILTLFSAKTYVKCYQVPKGELPQQPICVLNILLPDDIVTEVISLSDEDSSRKLRYLSEDFDYYRPDPRLTDLSNLLGDDWVALATKLGLSATEINVIKSQYPDSVAKQAQSMLRMWLSQYGDKTLTNTLENALKKIGRDDIIPQCLSDDRNDLTHTRIKYEEKGKHRLKTSSLAKTIKCNEDVPPLYGKIHFSIILFRKLTSL